MEDGECIETRLVPISQLLATLNRTCGRSACACACVYERAPQLTTSTLACTFMHNKQG
jgi:hypothetical protein